MVRTMTKKKRDGLFVVGMLLIPMSVFFVFWFLVNVNSILMAFQTSEGRFTLDNFKLFFEELRLPDPEGMGITVAVKNTFIYFAVGFFIKTPLTYLLSFFLYKKPPNFLIRSWVVLFMPFSNPVESVLHPDCPAAERSPGKLRSPKHSLPYPHPSRF